MSAASDPQLQQQHLRTALAVAGCAAAAGAIVYAAYRAADGVIPYRYHYRPGTITGWMASALGAYSQRRRRRRPVRVYMDGCFDMMHYGHANALRQAKALGDVLVVGLIPDAEIMRCKGPPVLNERERLELVGAVKWVDEVLTGVPYDLSPQFVDRLFRKHRIDYVIHGDDPCLLPDGTDAYAYAKKLGRFRVIKRTEGVSTTDIVGRMLTCTRGAAVAAARDEDPAAPHPLTKSFSQNERVARPSQSGGPEGAAAGEGGGPGGEGAAMAEQPAVRGLSSVAEQGGGGSSLGLAAAAAAAVAAAGPAGPAAAAAAAAAAAGDAKPAAAPAASASAPAPAPASAASSPSTSAFLTAKAAAAVAAAAEAGATKTTDATDGGSSVDDEQAGGAGGGDDEDGDADEAEKTVERVRVSQFLPTSRRLVQFSEGRPPPDGATVVYIDGAFDVFHTGHVAILKAAKAQGDFLLVGLHTDDDVSARRGPHLPIMNVHERALSVLACKHVDEVVIGAPEVISDSLLRTFNIGLVVRGRRCETGERASATTDVRRYALPRELGIFRELPSPDNTTTSSIITRIVDNRRAFEARNAKKVRSEAAYEGVKGYVKEV